MRRVLPLFSAVAAAACLAGFAAAQTPVVSQPHARISQPVDESSLVRLHGNVHPLVAASTSQALNEATPMEHMILFLKGDASQEAQLAQLLAAQNDPKSPLYHRFLTPQQFGSQFGVAQPDLAKIRYWLENHGFTIDEIPAGSRAIVFSGNAGQVADAFKTEIRHYNVAGVSHLANAADPQIPSALAAVVGGVVKLHDFRHAPSLSKASPLSAGQFANPEFDASGGGHYLAPADYATIYDINSLYSSGINGAGQSIAVIARSNISISDVQSFRTTFGLAANNPQIIFVNSNPGILQGDSTETTLDTEWSGAVAPNAAVKVVVAASTNTADGIDLSALYAVNNNVAPVVTLSYGSCEAAMGTAELGFYNGLWQQAAAQGMSVMVSSGDDGAACNGPYGPFRGVNGLCTSPYATCVGGTEFVEGNNPGQYWLPGNNSVYGSATGYIPEHVWNESGSNGGSGLWAGGGGASMAFAKPSWQAGAGVPADGHRDVPDVALTAAGHDGYVILQSGGLMAVGGTSAAAPSFAGIVALINQKTNARQGLANPSLYRLAQNQQSGGASAFHDINAGNNSVPGVTGFAAAPGYDLASGLGSVDAAVLVNSWAAGTTVKPSLSLSASSSALTIKPGQTSQATVTSTASATLKSAVSLSVTGAPAGVTATFSSAAIPSPGSGSVTLTVAVAASAKPGSYSLNVAAQGGGQTASLLLSLVIPAPPSFTLLASSASAGVIAGNAAQVSLSTTPQNGFNAPIALSVTGLPMGVSASFSPATLGGASAGKSVLSLTTAKTVKPGSYALVLTASGGGLTQTSGLTLAVTVPASCTLSANPGSLKLTAGQAASIQVSCGSVQGVFSAPLALSVSGAPNGVSAKLASTSLTAGSSTALNLATALATPAGSFTLSVSATGSGFTQTLALPVAVAAPSTFTLSTTQPAPVVKPGATAQLGLVAAHIGSFKSAISLNFAGLPSGVTASLSRTSLPAPGDGSSTVTFMASVTAKPGTYNVSFTGSGGGQTQTVAVTLTVAANQGFSFALNTSSLSIQQGGAAGIVIVSTGNFTGGFNSTITLTFSGLAPGMNYGATGATTGNNLVNTSIGFTASAATPAGTYPITITASGAGITHSGIVQMTVAKPAAQTHH